MITYASRKLEPHEAIYPTQDLDLGAMVFALKIWRHYLYGVWCTIYTDCKSLTYLMYQPNMNMRHYRWLNMVKDYECDTLYHPSKSNIMTDALNRRAVGAPIWDLCLTMTN